MELINLFVTCLLVENVVLTKFLGLCPFIGTSKKSETAVGMGIAVTFVIVLSSIITYAIYHVLLIPTDSEYLTTIIFILVIAAMVQLIELLIKTYKPTLYKSMGIYLPLITTNCAVLGVTLLNIKMDYTFAETLVYSLGSSLGFLLVIYIFSSIRERLDKCNIPVPFKGTPIALITAAIMSIIFGRFI